MGLTFDDVLPGARPRPTCCPTQVSHRHPAHPRHRARDPAHVRGDGHRHRGPPGDRPGPRGRHRRRSTATSRSRTRSPRSTRSSAPSPGMIVDPVTLGPDDLVGDALDLMAKYHISGVPITDGDAPPGRHPDQPRPALRERPARARSREVMTAEGLVTAPQGTTLEQAAGDPRPPPHREAAGGRRRRPHHRPDHRQGHPEEDQVPARHQGRPGPPARAPRRSASGADCARAGPGAGRRRRRPARRRHRARPLRRRARGRPPRSRPTLSRRRHRRQRRHRRRRRRR